MLFSMSPMGQAVFSLPSLFFFLSSTLGKCFNYGMNTGVIRCPDVLTDQYIARIAIYFASTALSGAFSGLLAAAIDQMDGKGGKPGWAWIFILVGHLTPRDSDRNDGVIMAGRIINLPLWRAFFCPSSPLTPESAFLYGTRTGVRRLYSETNWLCVRRR